MRWVETTSWWRRRLWADIAIAATCVLVLSKRLDLADDPATLYQVTGGAAIGLIAFVVTPVATLLSTSGGARFTAFDRRHRATVIRAMAWAFGLSVVTLGLALVGSAVDDAAHTAKELRWVTMTAAFAAGLGVGRLFWQFVAALLVRHADDERPLLEDRH